LKNILISGATGFIGSHVVDKLIAENFKVIAIKRSISSTERLKEVSKKVTFFDADKNDLSVVFTRYRIDAIIHCANIYGRNCDDRIKILEANVLLGAKLAELASRHNVKLFINTDTFYNTEAKTMPGRLGDYILSKRQFKEWLQLGGWRCRVVNLKLEHVYGVRDNPDKFIPWLIRSLHLNVTPIKLTEGKQKRDFVSAKDVAAAFVFCLKSSEKFKDEFQEYGVGTGQYSTLREYIEKICMIYEKTVGRVNSELDFGALHYPANEVMAPSDQISTLQELGWAPEQSFEETVASIIAEYEQESLH